MKRLASDNFGRLLTSIKSFALSAILAVIGPALCKETAEPPVKVEISPAQVSEKRVPAEELQKKLHGEAAYTDTQYKTLPAYSYSYLEQKLEPNGQYKMKVKVTNVDIKLSAQITVWLPIDAPESLVAHQNAHKDIYEQAYKRYIQLIEPAAKAVIGQEFSATAATKEAAEAEISQKIGDAVNDPFFNKMRSAGAGVNAIFDKLTENGVNQVDPRKAMVEAFRQYDDSQAVPAKPMEGAK